MSAWPLPCNIPGRIAGLGLVATQAAADTPERKAARYVSIEEVKQQGVRDLAEEMVEKLTSQPGLIPLVRQVILSTRPEGVIGSLKGLAERQDVSGQLSQIRVPAVVIAGAADKLNSLERSQGIARGLPMGRLVVIPDAGHMPMMEAPRAVADALAGLIRPDGA
jgi:pimeloyl-ACP methyl ester carboxylesterase